jgi:hypothetical protein
MPEELEATIVSNGVLNSSGVTAAEITAIEGFIEGTYALQYSQYISNRAEYIFNFPDPPYDYLGAAGNYLQYLVLQSCWRHWRNAYQSLQYNINRPLQKI